MMVLTLITGLLVAYAVTPVPPIEAITKNQTTTVLYSDRSIITKFVFDQQNRKIVPVNEMPDYVLWSAVSAEDRTFYQNKGISPLGIVRAFWNDIQGRPLQGGSTITQQYVKNTRVTTDRTLSRKIKEFFIAIKIANQTDKKALLGDYLNTIYFGRGCYGIQAAAQAYFGKSAINDPTSKAAYLTLPEAAYLAGIIDGPELYDVDAGASQTTKAQVRAKAKVRYDYVLDGLVKLGVITQADRDGKYAAMPTLLPKAQPKPATQNNDQTPYLTQMVQSELNTLSATYPELAPGKIETGGYNIYTTFDKGLTDQAVKSVVNVLGDRSTWKARTQIGMASLDPTTGAVKAIYGGDGKRSESAVTQDTAEGGSTFKLFALLAALQGQSKTGQDGISLQSLYSGASPLTYDSKYVRGSTGNKVYNDPGPAWGMVDLKTALKYSINTVFARLNEAVDPKNTRLAALDAGIPASDGVTGEISNELGNAPVHVLDMASAYATVDAEGMYTKPYVIDRIVAPDGTVVYRHTSTPVRRFATDVCDDAIAALQQPTTPGGTAQWAGNHMDGRPIAGKTGTVGAPGSRKTLSSWFVGFTPQLVTAVGMYRIKPDGVSQDDVIGWGPFEGQDMQGGYFPTRVWTDFMGAALKGQPHQPFPSEKDVGQLNPAGQAAQAAQQAAASPSPTDVSPSPTDPNAQPTDPNNPGQSPTGTGAQNGGGTTGQNGGNGGQTGNNGGQNTGGTTGQGASPSP